MKILSGQGIVEVLGLTVLYLFSLTLAYLINFFFNICFGFSAFVFKNLWGSNLLKTSIVAFMSGSLIPLAFFPKVVSAILSFLPFSSLIYTPVMIIVGKYDASQILQALLLQFFWLIVMVGLSQLIWKRVQSFITIQEVSMKKYQRMHLIFIRQYIKQIMEYKVIMGSLDSRAQTCCFSMSSFHTHPRQEGWTFQEIAFIYGFSLNSKGIRSSLF